MADNGFSYIRATFEPEWKLSAAPSHSLLHPPTPLPALLAACRLPGLKHASNTQASIKLEHCKKITNCTKESLNRLPAPPKNLKPQKPKANKTTERTHTHTHSIWQPKCPVMRTAALGTGLELDLPKLDWSGTGTGLSRHEPVASCLPVFACDQVTQAGSLWRLPPATCPSHAPWLSSFLGDLEVSKETQSASEFSEFSESYCDCL